MHDLFRDLCLLKANAENFLRAVDCLHNAVHPPPMATNAWSMGKMRRLAIYLDSLGKKPIPTADEIGGHLRSLLYYGPTDTVWALKSPDAVTSIVGGLKLLRVLRIEGMQLDKTFELPREVGNMVHLRFLSLRESSIGSFPAFLGKLVSLLTLDYRVTDWYGDRNPLIIPNVILKMKRLQHLYLPSFYKTIGILQLPLADLQTLDYVDDNSFEGNDLHRFKNLRKLRIRFDSFPAEIPDGILEAAASVLNGIQTLTLDSTGLEVVSKILDRSGLLYKLNLKLRLHESSPNLSKKLLQFYSNLTRLSFNCNFCDSPIPILENLPNLKSLTLQHPDKSELPFGMPTGMETYYTVELVFSNGSFPSLNFLAFIDWKGLTDWRVEEGALPSLSKLVIENCDSLTSVPDGLRYLISLKKLRVQMLSEFVENLKEGGEDFHKVQHIPSRVYKPYYYIVSCPRLQIFDSDP